jgi:HKD family nuclease
MPGDRGIREVLVTEAIREELSALGRRFEIVEEPLNPAEAADRLALHVSRLLLRAFRDVESPSDLTNAVEQVRQIVDLLKAGGDAPIEPATVLRALLARLPDGSPERVERPLIPLLDTTLLTNAPGEPRVGSQLLTEVQSADRIDLVMAFIRMSGVRPLLDALRQHCEAERSLRILTTTYTGSTEREALEALASLGAKVRVSYETGSTRLHAKAWLFHRASGFSTAYIGSSNLTFSAQVTGLEWNVRVSGARNPDVIEKIAAVFESYYASPDFVPFVAEEFSLATRRESAPELLLSPIELRPEPFQERLLEQIELSRQRGHHRNLLVSATGTGKTVMAAVDYARLRRILPRARLLFVAHREEILEQARATFRHAIRDHAFGERWVGVTGLSDSSLCSRPSNRWPEPISRISRPAISTLSSWTSFITRRRLPIAACSIMFVPRSCSRLPRPLNAPTARTFCTGSMGASRPSFGSGTRLTSTVCVPLPTTVSRTAWTFAACHSVMGPAGSSIGGEARRFGEPDACSCFLRQR